MFKRLFKLTVFTAVLPLSAQASLESLAKEFLEANSEVNTARANVNLSKLNVDTIRASKAWTLSLASEMLDSSKNSSATYNQLNSKSTSHVLSLSKDLMWGGEVSLANIYSNKEGSDFGGSSKVYGFDQTLTYTQDIGANFLGRNDRLDVEIANRNYLTQKISSENSIENSLFNFSSFYIQAKLNRSLLDLQKEAGKRAQKREVLIRRRVKDGLREKVDLYLAQSSLLATREEVKNIRTNLASNLEALSNALHRNVKINEISVFNLGQDKLAKLPLGNIENNKEYETLKRSAETVMSGLNKSKNELLPTFKISTSYSTNEFANKGSTTISDGNLTSDNSAYTVGLNLAWSIGSQPQKLERAKYRIQLKDAVNKKGKVLKNFDNSEKTLLLKIKNIDYNINSAQERLNLSTKAFEEYNRLYSRGRTDLDQLIRSEENLINTEKSYASYLAKRETYIYALSRLYGNLQTQLTSERE